MGRPADARPSTTGLGMTLTALRPRSVPDSPPRSAEPPEFAEAHEFAEAFTSARPSTSPRARPGQSSPARHRITPGRPAARARPGGRGRPDVSAPLRGAAVSWDASGRPTATGVTPAALAPHGTPFRRPPVRPEPVDETVRELLDGSLGTPAGRFFVPAWTNPGRLPLAPPGLFVVHLGAERTGFLANGQPVAPETLAQVIENCHEWGHRPVLVVARPCPSETLLAGLAEVLTAHLRVSVHAADTGLWQLPGIVFTGGTLRRWGAVGLDDGTHDAPTAPEPLPVAEAVQAPALTAELVPAAELESTAELARGSAPGATAGAEPVQVVAAPPVPVPVSVGAQDVQLPVALPVVVRWTAPTPPEWSPTARPQTPADQPAPVREGPSAPPVGPRAESVELLPWVAVRPGATPADREPLRALLGWRYEAHARAIMGMLALQPGLRSVSDSVDVLSGLVALRAYLSAAVTDDAARTGDGSPVVTAGLVDSVLRGTTATAGGTGAGAGEAERAGALLLARCAAAGLSRLPAAAGPVFRPALADPRLATGLRRGQILAEPGFLRVSTTPWTVPGQTVCYAIWSATARRTDRLGSPGQPAGPGGPGGPGSPGGPGGPSGSGGSGGSGGFGSPADHALFTAGTRFVVLDVLPGDGAGHPYEGTGPGNPAGTGPAGQPPGEPSRPVWVLLRECFGGRADDALDERARGRLRELVARLAQLPAPGPLAAASPGAVEPGRTAGPLIGLGDGDRPYAPEGGDVPPHSRDVPSPGGERAEEPQ
ncbi:hypothetical protein [Frankia sp. CcI49]|uniref:hypothetical protein n=1 Tax=Frankia sp. CcI49 TaxID=1745382 RepID=UPI00130434F4|nr:hypothetical protein [Frankia sp. CcI49]